MLNPPRLLDGSEFHAFKENDCGQFGFGLQNVSDSEYSEKLICLAFEYRKPRVSQETLRFCKELRILTEHEPELNDDAKMLERYVKRAYGRIVEKNNAKRKSKSAAAHKKSLKKARAVRGKTRRSS
jgi:hypothetical protein